MKRRDVLKVLMGGAAASMLRPSWVAANTPPEDFFIFIHAAGGWDVTLWADPRNERKGLVEPASTTNLVTGGLKHWKDAPLDGDVRTFEILAPGGSSQRFGPAIGDLYDLRDRLTIINGIAMNTVSHEDGTTFSATGRHRTGGTLPESSIDVLIANELGIGQIMPDVSVKFPSAFVGDRLDRRAIPLRVGNVEAITKSFGRSTEFLDATDRSAISAVLSEEARELARGSTYPATYDQLASQHQAMPTLLTSDFTEAFTPKQLQAAYPQFDYRGRFMAAGAVAAAFAIEAMKRNVVRCVSFGLGGLDTHVQNYRGHAHILQELFGIIATLVKVLDATPHPTRTTAKLSHHVHILVVSEFCRTPQINPSGGRDHYPNNSALVISPRFRGGRTFGSTDLEQLLPMPLGQFTDGRRATTPADLLATFLGAFGIDPRRYMRDGEIVKGFLA